MVLSSIVTLKLVVSAVPSLIERLRYPMPLTAVSVPRSRTMKASSPSPRDDHSVVGSPSMALPAENAAENSELTSTIWAWGAMFVPGRSSLCTYGVWNVMSRLRYSVPSAPMPCNRNEYSTPGLSPPSTGRWSRCPLPPMSWSVAIIPSSGPGP